MYYFESQPGLAASRLAPNFTCTQFWESFSTGVSGDLTASKPRLDIFPSNPRSHSPSCSFLKARAECWIHISNIGNLTGWISPLEDGLNGIQASKIKRHLKMGIRTQYKLPSDQISFAIIMQMIVIHFDRSLSGREICRSGAIQKFRVSSPVIKSCLLKPGARIFLNRRTHMAAVIAHRDPFKPPLLIYPTWFLRSE